MILRRQGRRPPLEEKKLECASLIQELPQHLLAREDGEILAISSIVIRQQRIRGNDGRWRMTRHEVISFGNPLSMPGSIVHFTAIPT